MNTSAIHRDLVIVACAVSAGIHAALAPEHFREGAAAGSGFLAAAVLLAAVAAALTRRPADGGTYVATAAILAGLIGSYVLAITTGVPLLHPEVEPTEVLAVATKAVEAVGLLASARLLRQMRTPVRHSAEPKGTLT